MRLPLPETRDRHASFYLNYQDIDQPGPVAGTFMGELRYQTHHLPLSDDEG